MDEKFDVVVIGAGLGGLSAAAYLSKAGKKVLVLEHHTVPGGYAHEFRRGKYRFEVALHALDGAAPGGWAYQALKDLDILEQVHFHRMDPFYTVRFPRHEITAHADISAYEVELARGFPHERAGIHSMIADMLETYWQVRRFALEGDAGTRPPMDKIPALYPKMLSAMSTSWGDYMDQFIQDAELKAVFSALWGYYGLPPAQLNAAVFIFPWVSYHLMGAYYPEGGSMAISRALEKTIQKHGGEIRYRQTVSQIEMVGGRAAVVLTEKGLRVEAGVVISNANIPDTLLKFVGREHLPASYVSRIESIRPSISNLVLYLGLDSNLRAEGWDHHEMFIAEGYDLDQDYQAALAGDFSRTAIALTNYDRVDPSCAPEGGSVLSIFSLADWNTDNQWGTGGDLEKYSQNPRYNELKQAAAEAILDRAEKVIPGLRKSIKHIEIATPLTNWRYSLNTAGSIYGSEQTVENTYSGRLNAHTPIPNLFLAGAWTFGGGMSAALLSGRETSRMVQGFIDGSEVVLMSGPDMAGIETSSPAPAPLPPSAPVALKPSASPASSNPAPDITLKAVGSGREFRLNTPGRRSVLIFHGPDTADAAQAVNQFLRARDEYQKQSSLLIANVVDLQSIPKLFRGIAERAMHASYEKACALIPPSEDPGNYVVILPDWDGSATRAFGLKETAKTAGLAVLDEQGNLLGTYQGGDPEAQVLALLQKHS